MDKRLRIAELISSDIRSRANANIIRSAIDGINNNITLDFKDVLFISRSFADELYNLVAENINISLDNMNGLVESMYDAVVQGRKSERIFKEESAEIKEFDDMKSLASFLSTI